MHAIDILLVTTDSRGPAATTLGELRLTNRLRAIEPRPIVSLLAAASPAPGLIVIDAGDRSLVHAIRAAPDHAAIPIVVLGDGRDLAALADEHACAHVATPITPARFVAALRELGLGLEVVRPDEPSGAATLTRCHEAAERLATGIAHDFNNLLMIIQGNASVLPYAEREEISELAVDISQAASRAGSLVRQLMMFGRLQPLRAASLDVHATLSDAMRRIENVLGEGVGLVVEAAAALPTAFGDVAQVEEALVNLAIHARDVMPNGGKLTLTTLELTLDDADAAEVGAPGPGRYVGFSARDDGPRFTPEELARRWLTPVGVAGRHLGLASVRAIAERHAGFADARCDGERGTTVRVLFPTVL